MVLKKYYFFHVFNFFFKWFINIINVYKNWLLSLHIFIIMKLLFSEIILIIIKLFNIKYFTILQNIYLLSLKNFVLIITYFLKIFINQYYILKLLLIFVWFTKLLIIRMIKFFIHVNNIELWKSFITFIILLLKNCLIIVMN